MAIIVAACVASVPPPAALVAGQEACGNCRMIVSDAQFASQIVAPGDEPKFFDDMGCLTHYLTTIPVLPKGAVIYVADHRTRAWVRADLAVYTRAEALTAPMGSHVVAHETAASRDADAGVVKGVPVALADVFPSGLPGGSR